MASPEVPQSRRSVYDYPGSGEDVGGIRGGTWGHKAPPLSREERDRQALKPVGGERITPPGFED